jgi:hypothetical protein
MISGCCCMGWITRISALTWKSARPSTRNWSKNRLRRALPAVNGMRRTAHPGSTRWCIRAVRIIIDRAGEWSIKAQPGNTQWPGVYPGMRSKVLHTRPKGPFAAVEEAVAWIRNTLHADKDQKEQDQIQLGKGKLSRYWIGKGAGIRPERRGRSAVSSSTHGRAGNRWTSARGTASANGASWRACTTNA